METTGQDGQEHSRASFPRTQWSLVAAAQGDDPDTAAALNQLCTAYWRPVYAFIRRRGYPPAEAEDLTQGFFQSLLTRGSLNRADHQKGRLRTFLLTAVTRFMANQNARVTAAKRGGGAYHLPLDCGAAEEGFVPDPGHEITPDLEFDRQWAADLLRAAMARLQDQYVAAGQGDLFDALRGAVSTEDEVGPYTRIATRFSMSEGAVKVAVHRLRARFRTSLLEVIAETVTHEPDVETELAQVFDAFRTPATTTTAAPDPRD